MDNQELEQLNENLIIAAAYSSLVLDGAQVCMITFTFIYCLATRRFHILSNKIKI